MRNGCLNSNRTVSHSFYTIPLFRKADLGLHLQLLVTVNYRYLYGDFALKIVSCGCFTCALDWCCWGEKMAIYFGYFCTVATAIEVAVVGSR